jgi:HK97 family phage portal protein
MLGFVNFWPWSKPEPKRAAPRTIFSGELGSGGLRFNGLQATDALLEQVAGLTNARVSRRDALRAMAVLRARNLISGVCATLPIELRDKDRNLDERDWLGYQPNDLMPDTVTYAYTYEDLLFEATSYWRITRWGSDGYPIEAEHLDHRSVSTSATASLPSRMISEDLPFAPNDPIHVDGHYADPREVIRFVSPNPPLLVHAGRAIRTILLLDKISSEYANNPLPFGYFKDAADEPPLDDDEVKEMLSKWEHARRERMWGYVESGLELNMLEWPSPQALQLTQARNHAVLEIARATGLEPENLATVVEGTSRTYQNAEDQRLGLIDFTLMPYLSAVQDRLSMHDIVPRGLKARYDISAFARADTKTRMETHNLGISSGLRKVNEARRKEGEPDLTAEELEEIKQNKKPPEPKPEPVNADEPPEPASVPSNGNGQAVGRTRS